QLAEAVSDDDGRGDLVAERVPAVWQDGGDAGVDRVTSRHGRVPDAHARHVGDGVEGTRRQATDDEADVARPGAGRLARERGGDEAQEEENVAHRLPASYHAL